MVQDVFTELMTDWRAGRSAPRPAGASMLRRPDNTVVGSVSGEAEGLLAVGMSTTLADSIHGVH